MRVMRFLVVLLAACGSSSSNTCDPQQNTGCDHGQVCVLAGSTPSQAPLCVAPVILEGQVFDLSTKAGIASAQVVALDANGAPISDVATTDASGDYTLRVFASYASDGTPSLPDVTLRADAKGYVAFPGGIRQALPIQTSGATMTNGQYVVMSAVTNVGLIGQPGGGSAGSIHGKLALPTPFLGALVAAEGNGQVVTGLADRHGDFELFNVPDGTWNLTAYAQGSTWTTVQVTVNGGDVRQDLALGDVPTSKVTGSVNLVNPGSGTATSVILVLESTFDTNLARGETPPGLRAENVTNAFEIDGVPPGKYVVLAAFENDGLVRDPDTSISGTQIVHLTVTAGQDAPVSTSFKVTGSLDVISPGANGLDTVTGPLEFTWVDDSSEDAYDVFVYDAFGNQVWTTTIPGSSGTNPVVPYMGPSLTSGMIYQFKAVSSKKGVPISTTEDLKGVFQIQ